MKREILKTILIVWLFAATSYVVYNEWNSYKTKGIDQAYQQGRIETITQLIDQTTKNGCQPVDVNLQDKKIQVVDATCLSQAALQQFPAAAAK
jgi:hypothetical protein